MLYQVEPLPVLVRPKGFEPLTFWFVAKHSIQLSYGRILLLNKKLGIKQINGGSDRNRTCDTRIFSPLLYRLSYEAIMAVSAGIEPVIFCVTGRRVNHCTTKPLVAGEGFEPPTYGL